MQFSDKHVADKSVGGIPADNQNHAEGRNPHLQGPALVKPDVEENERCGDDEQAHHDGAEIEDVALLCRKPEVVHVDALHAFLRQEMSNGKTQTNDAEHKSSKQIEGLNAL